MADLFSSIGEVASEIIRRSDVADKVNFSQMLPLSRLLQVLHNQSDHQTSDFHIEKYSAAKKVDVFTPLDITYLSEGL